MSLSLDAGALLALAAKCIHVFTDGSDPRKFVSIPATPIVFDAGELSFAEAAAANPQAAFEAWGEFASLMNCAPDGPVLRLDRSQTTLWAALQDVLDRIEYAVSDLTKDEQQRYAAAMKLLYVEIDGVRAPSPALRTYLQLRDAYHATMQEYRNRQEPELLERAELAMSEWDAVGRKAQIERALDTQQQLGQRNPAAAWELLRTRIGSRSSNPPGGLDQLTTPQGAAFFPTGFAPSDALAVPWPRITIGATDIAALAASVPEALAAAFGNPSTTSDILEVSFDYCSVTVTRTWIDPRILRFRSWRLPAGDAPLSDGRQPPTGAFPSMISAAVLARNITVRRKVASSPGSTSSPPPLGGPIAEVVEPVLTRRWPGIARAGDSPVLARPARGVVAAPPRVLAPAAEVRLRPVATLVERPVLGSDIAVRMLPSKAPFVWERLAAIDYPKVLDVIPPTTHEPPPDAPGEESVTTAPDIVYVMALLCQQLNLSPNPDPAFDWTTD